MVVDVGWPFLFCNLSKKYIVTVATRTFVATNAIVVTTKTTYAAQSSFAPHKLHGRFSQISLSTRIFFNQDSDLGHETQSGCRQVLRLTWKVRRENEPPESAQLNFGATFRGIFSLWLPCWAQIWIVQHINSVFLMRNRIHTQNSQRNHLLSLIPSFGTLFDKWISHIHRMDLSFAGVLFLYNSTLQLVRLTWNDHTSENVVF